MGGLFLHGMDGCAILYGMNDDTQGGRWGAHVRRALEPQVRFDREHLLIVQDLNGLLARQMEPPPGRPTRQSAVLILLYPDGDDLRLPLTVRADHLPSHKGEVALPGGAIDPHDDGPVATALREYHEELGGDPAQVTVWGTLEQIYIPVSNFQVTPVVGFVPAAPVLYPNTDEVQEVITATVRELLDPATVGREQRTLRGYELLVPFFRIAGYHVWGATALMLSELVARLRAIDV